MANQKKKKEEDAHQRTKRKARNGSKKACAHTVNAK